MWFVRGGIESAAQRDGGCLPVLRIAYCGNGVVEEVDQAGVPAAVQGEEGRGDAGVSDVAGRFVVCANGLFRAAESNGVKGVYIPAWTYDSNTETDYTGERGVDYQETETYTDYENGKPVTRTRTVTKTRWYPVRGHVRNTFQDVLVLASESLPRKHADKLAPWDLKNLTPYTDDYLSGFVAESYQIDLPHGFDRAREIMEPTIRQTICSDIGGDHQRIGSTNTAYNDIKFEHLLLPIWISAYRYLEKTYQFLVNARTGEVQGERPWSVWKIVLLVVTILAVIGIIVMLVNMRHG